MKLKTTAFHWMSGFLFLLMAAHGCNVQAKQIRVMEIDTGIGNHIDILHYVEAGSFDDMNDLHGHGTHIAGIIASSNCPNLKIVSCKFYFKDSGIVNRLTDCLERALKERIDIINFSGGGEGFIEEEYKLMEKIDAMGIKIVVAAGNGIDKTRIGKNLGSPCFGYFPACYRLPNMVIVGNKTTENERVESSNYGIPGMVWEYGEDVMSTLPNNKYGTMTGTSQAAAIYTKHLVQKMCYQ
jgi:subtilisin family serine protease